MSYRRKATGDRSAYLIHPQFNQMECLFWMICHKLFVTSLEVEIGLRVLHSCRLLLKGHSGIWVLPQVAALLERHVWAFESLGVYNYKWGLWKMSPSQILEKCSFKFSLSDDGFLLTATALLYSNFCVWISCGAKMFSFPWLFPQVFIPNVAGSALSQSPKLHMLLYFLAYLSILVAAAA